MRNKRNEYLAGGEGRNDEEQLWEGDWTWSELGKLGLEGKESGKKGGR